MIKFVRPLLGILFVVIAIWLFALGYNFLGVVASIISVLLIVFYFFNEKIMLTFLLLKRNKMNEARKLLESIKNPEKLLTSRQQGTYYFMLGSAQGQDKLFQSEKFFKRALAIGLRLSYYRVISYLSLASIAIAKGNRREAEAMLGDAKKNDKNKMFADQIKMVRSQLNMAGAQKAMKMQTMMGNRPHKAIIRR
ncbi:MAG: DUF2892 domain-containing protein [Solitalea-like symbiont of Acarus siro]